jgi:(E)-4-hydroxy-3-methylbut-2-enyl-diphosphate synthase
VTIPVVADIHFDYRLALAAIDHGVAKIRLNPGNISNQEHITAVVNHCKTHNIPIRIGINKYTTLLDSKKETVINSSNNCSH